jgi:predicted enzyme related to lactoylglutathione lyase
MSIRAAPRCGRAPLHARLEQQKSDATVARVAMNLEVDALPVSDIERSKQFYQRLGWRLDEDVSPAKETRIRAIHIPPARGGVIFGNGLAAAAPGSGVTGLAVSDTRAARAELSGRVSTRVRCGMARPSPKRAPSRPDPKRRAMGRSSTSRIPTAMHGWSKR